MLIIINCYWTATILFIRNLTGLVNKIRKTFQSLCFGAMSLTIHKQILNIKITTCINNKNGKTLLQPNKILNNLRPEVSWWSCIVTIVYLKGAGGSLHPLPTNFRPRKQNDIWLFSLARNYWKVNNYQIVIKNHKLQTFFHSKYM